MQWGGSVRGLRGVDHGGPDPPVLRAICSFSMRMLCRWSGGNMAICWSDNCNTCMISAAWGEKGKILLVIAATRQNNLIISGIIYDT